MDDLGLNEYLKNTYGTTQDGQVLFRLLWNDKSVTEKRHSTYRDFHDDMFIREVTEVREVWKYPFAMDRWILETICPVPESVYGTELFTKYSYEGIYVFQDRNEQFLPLSKEMLEAAMYLYLTQHRMKYSDKLELRMQWLAAREKEKRQETLDIIDSSLRSPLFLPVIEDPKKLLKRRPQ